MVKHGGRAEIIQACLKRSYLWPRIKKCRLHENMRVKLSGNPNDAAFAEQLLRIGEGKEGIDSFLIPCHMTQGCDSIDGLINEVYGDINSLDQHILQDRCILATLNDTVTSINTKVNSQTKAPETISFSADSIIVNEKETKLDQATIDERFPTEMVNSDTPSGFPVHMLSLKTGAPLLLLRNINSHLGLCNGTKLIIKSATQRVLDVQIVNGSRKGDRVFLPRIRFIDHSSELAYILIRVQFPVTLAYAMTINKVKRCLRGFKMKFKI